MSPNRRRDEPPRRPPETALPSGSLRLLHVVAPARFGGLERVVHALAAGQAAAGHRVQVVAILDQRGDHPFVAAVRSAGVRVSVLHTPRRGYLSEFRQLREVIRELRPDVVHTHGYRPDMIAGQAARSEGVPTVTTSHGFSYGDWRNRLYEWLQRRAFRAFDAVVAVSRPMADGLRAAGVPDRLLKVIPNGLADDVVYDRARARELLGISTSDFRVGWVGRFAWAKALDVFIASLAQIRDVPWAASIIGAGAHGAAARARAEELGIEPRLHWHGEVENAGRLLGAFDVLVISSRTEGTPIILLEAMRAHVPIVTTAVGGIPDVVGGEHALLVPPDPAAIARAIEASWRDQNAARTRAAAAHERLQDYSMKTWIERYDAVYRGILEERGRVISSREGSTIP